MTDTTTCTCDDEDTLVSVDFGYEDGGVQDICVSCYDALQGSGELQEEEADR